MAEDNFKEGLQNFLVICHQKQTRQLRRYSLKALQLAVEGTPVLTGCCRANWIVSNGELKKDFQPGKLDIAGGPTITASMGTLESAKIGVPVFIENSCPYVLKLENGWSKQGAPGCMIRTPLQKLKQAIAMGAK